jgi:hypothetical protein
LRVDLLHELCHFIATFLHSPGVVDTAVQEFTISSKKAFILEG